MKKKNVLNPLFVQQAWTVHSCDSVCLGCQTKQRANLLLKYQKQSILYATKHQCLLISSGGFHLNGYWMMSFLPSFLPPSLSLFLSFFFFLGVHLGHMEVPSLGVHSELELPATAAATRDLSQILNLCHSLKQRQILNSLTEAGDGTRILIDTSWVLNPLSRNGNSMMSFFRGNLESYWKLSWALD